MVHLLEPHRTMNCGLSTCGFCGSLVFDIMCKARTHYYVLCGVNNMCFVDLILGNLDPYH
jgi:hypothetical protein